jgi:hypothetical protein
VHEVWRVYAEKWAEHPNVIWQLGLRGVADRPMWQADPNVPQSDTDRGRIISEAMAEQVKILDAVCPKRLRLMSTTLWAEGSVLNQKGLLTIPKEAIIVFADNSPGWKWQRDFYETPRNPQNSYGVYYHHGLIGCGPHLAQVVPPHKTYEMMRTALDKGAGEYAIFNVSNIREFVLGIDATAKMTWRMEGYDADVWLDRWVQERFSKKRAEIVRAYKTFFNAYQIHALQHVPFLMDGQMFGEGQKNLSQMSKKLKAGKIGTGTEQESITFGEETSADVAERDAFWAGLSDTSPKSLGRRDSIQRVAAQRTGFELACLQAQAAANPLTEEEAAFLQDNLIYPSAFMRQTSTWLQGLLLAHEALDLGDRQTCARALAGAEEAFAKIPGLAEGYCTGKWQTWYRGCKKLNVSAVLQKTHDVVTLAKGNRP